MCLQITQLHPHNKSTHRYKVLNKSPYWGDGLGRTYRSLYRSTVWVDNKLEISHIPKYYLGDFSDFGGIHVFMTLEEAKKSIELSAFNEFHEIVRIRVSGFIGAGQYTGRFADWAVGWNGELWSKAKITKVYGAQKVYQNIWKSNPIL